MRELAILAVIGVGTYAMRAAFLGPARPEPPAWAARLLAPVGPAVLAAITVPALLAPTGHMSAVDTPAALLAACVAAVLWRPTHSLPLALFGGLAAWWTASWLLALG